MALSKRHGINPKTVAKWKRRTSVSDRPTGPKDAKSTTLSIEEEAIVVAFRQHTLLPLDDCLYALRATIPNLTRSSLHRCLQRHGISRLPEVTGDKPVLSCAEGEPKRKFKTYPIGYVHIDIAEVRTAEGKLQLYVGIDRTSKFAFVQLVTKANRVTASAFLVAEFQILDRRSFGRFLGLDDGDNTPDETTIWRFRDALVRADAVDALFARFNAHLKSRGYLAMGGQIMDASIIAAPRQRMTDEERAIVKGGGIPVAWAARPAKLAQKDRDARWTLKRGRRKMGPHGKLMIEMATPMFGYKSHINVDQRHGFIRTWSTSDASRCDGRELADLLDPANTGSSVWADTAYRSQKNEKTIARVGRVSKIHFRRAPGKPLKPQRQRANAARSQIRSAVEYVFAAQKHRMGLFIRTIGIDRAKAKIGLANIAFNFKRFLYWEAKMAAT